MAIVLELQPGQELNVPIWTLRWTHATVNARMAFGDEHDHRQESIFRLLENLLYGRTTPADLTDEDPLNVYVHIGLDGCSGLYSRQNRRLVALLMFQVCRREEALYARCIVRSTQDRHWRQQWNRGDDNTTGFSITPRNINNSRARHQ